MKHFFRKVEKWEVSMLQTAISIARKLISWAEQSLIDGAYEDDDTSHTIRNTLSQLGLASIVH